MRLTLAANRMLHNGRETEARTLRTRVTPEYPLRSETSRRQARQNSIRHTAQPSAEAICGSPRIDGGLHFGMAEALTLVTIAVQGGCSDRATQARVLRRKKKNTSVIPMSLPSTLLISKKYIWYAICLPVNIKSHFLAFLGEAGLVPRVQVTSAERQKQQEKATTQTDERKGMMRELDETKHTEATCLTFSCSLREDLVKVVPRGRKGGTVSSIGLGIARKRSLERGLTGSVCCHMDDALSVREWSRVHRDYIFSFLWSYRLPELFS